MDSQLLNSIFDKVIGRNSRFGVPQFEIGRTNEDFSRLHLKVTAPHAVVLRQLLEALVPLGCRPRTHQDAALKSAEADGVVPDDFYSTTNHETFIKHFGAWVAVHRQRMDAVIAVSDGGLAVESFVMSDVPKPWSAVS